MNITHPTIPQYRVNNTDFNFTIQQPIIVTNTAGRKMFVGVPQEQIAINQSGNILIDCVAEILSDATVKYGDPVYWNTNTLLFTAIDTAYSVQVGIWYADGIAGKTISCRISMAENYQLLDGFTDLENQVNALDAQINPVETEGTILYNIAELTNQVDSLTIGTQWLALEPVITVSSGTITNLSIEEAEYKVYGAAGIYAYLEIFIDFICDLPTGCDSIDIDNGLSSSYLNLNYYYRQIEEVSGYYSVNDLLFTGDSIKQSDLNGLAANETYHFKVSYKAKVEII